MESVNVINVGILALLFIVPIALLKYKRSKRTKLFLDPLAALAEKSHSKIMEHDIWNNAVIGIDKNTHTLFVIKGTDETRIQKEIDLREVQSCKLNNTSRTVNTSDGPQTIIEKLELIFAYRDRSKSEASIEFYNSKFDNLTINEEFKLTGKWLEIINIELLNIAAKK